MAEPHAYLNGLSRERAALVLERCCGARAWVEQMLALRPFASSEALYGAAERVWGELSVDSQLEAFAHHPRIGGSVGDNALSAKEQAGTAGADTQLMAALRAGNVAYEHRFGFVFLVCATGKRADEMLALLTERLTHDRRTELRIAAAEHARITRIRLEGLGA
ncbi:MAG TPA: 2-oxo-4-hydroxy-4-carboxy-5-ureidoimidazoline decarboxylase [Polyangiales bacterium]|nr:2-oxo-4-hydroxy-4-carboxy-5-ureidoimidazoline decarboxylase [Polyangiales bacterium]